MMFYLLQNTTYLTYFTKKKKNLYTLCHNQHALVWRKIVYKLFRNGKRREHGVATGDDRIMTAYRHDVDSAG